ncbi:MAG: hypothetical protein WCJ67_04015 [Thermoleophilia bacterium]
MTTCPRCGAGLAAGQEYCLECGLRLPVTGRVGSPPPDRRKAVVAVLVSAVVAVAGAALAVGVTREPAAANAVLRATGGSEFVATPTVTDASRFEQWATAKSAWTIVLVSVPKVKGRDAAIARAAEARRKGLRGVGILDSSRFASLHPGYWIVFAGTYLSEPEATGHLRAAKSVQRGARTERIHS